MCIMYCECYKFRYIVWNENVECYLMMVKNGLGVIIYVVSVNY